MKRNILVIDDKIKICQSLAQNFDQRGYQTFFETTEEKALALFSKYAINVVLLDIMLGEQNGLEVLQELLLIKPDIPVIMITGYGSIDTAVQSIKLGAFDYVTKPLDFEKLFNIVESAANMSGPSEEKPHRKKHIGDPPKIITQHKKMLELCAKAKKLAATDLPILLTGENGTGKEIIADFIHMHSSRNTRKMLKINCAAFPETLLDNELFGHERGAYTGADTAFKGVFERAHGSSLFLDEIGDMSLTIQAKILRTLQHHEIRRIGGERTITVNVRFIAATNRDPEELIAAKKFREDLFYRLNTAILYLPPLRERKEDIPLFVEHFLSEYSRMNSTHVKKVSDEVLEIFLDYHWPGNVRELKNAVNYAAAISSNDVIEIDALPPHFSPVEPPNISDNIREDVEKTLILKMLQKANYNKTRTAELLKMSRKTLYNKLEKYGISPSK